MKWTVGFLILAAMSLSSFAFDVPKVDVPKVKVIGVIDGNTIEILDNNGEHYKILLYGIDSPDSGQHFAIEARQLLAGLVLDKQVTLVMHGKDNQGNRIAEVQADGMPDPNYELVRLGFAWTTEQDEELESLKQHARTQGLGLWIDENPMPPWMWRRHLSMMHAKSS